MEVFPAPLSPTSTVVGPAGAESVTASSKEPRRSARSATSIGERQRETERDEADGEQHGDGHGQEQHRQRNRGVEVTLQGDVHRQRHRLRDARHVSRKGDRRAELTERPSPTHRRAGEQGRESEREHDPAGR